MAENQPNINHIINLTNEKTTVDDGSGGGNQPKSGEFLTIPRGGPLYVPNLVSPLTSVPHFQSTLLLELQVHICIFTYFFVRVYIYIFLFLFGSFQLILICFFIFFFGTPEFGGGTFLG